MKTLTSRSNNIKIILPALYPAQQTVKEHARRYNVLCWGRRAGKTTYGADRVVRISVVNGGQFGWFAPNYKVLNPVWDYFKELFAPLTIDKDEQGHLLKLITGGSLECWSMDSGLVARSRKYHGTAVDEAAFTPNLLRRWEKEIAPTLVDYRGTADFYSTPDGHNDFETLFNNSLTNSDWASFKVPSWENPFLPEDERERVRYLAEVVGDPVARQEYGAEFMDAVDVFVPADWWDMCFDYNLPALTEYDPLYIALDAGVSSDCFALVAVSKSYNQFFVRHAQIWQPPKGGKIDFSQPEQVLRDLIQTNRVARIVYDPYQLHDMATRLDKEGLGYFEPLQQGQPRLIADKFLQDIIREKRLHHSNQPDLSQHVKNANAKLAGDKLRIVKRTESLKIDAAVALSMACYSANESGDGPMTELDEDTYNIFNRGYA
jgi:hypothetical protein